MFDPVLVMTAVAQFTKYIGLLSTATTTYDEPYSLSRRYASLDHLSKGRACWNIVTTSYPDNSLNFSRTEHVAKDERYERANEFVEICKGLWDSWADDAFVQNKATGQFLDPTRVRALNHVGKHFQVKGPLNVARMPQGYPVLFTAGQSEDGRELAAKHADCLFAVTNTIETGKKFYADVKGRLDKYGRTPNSMRIIPGCAVYVGRTAGGSRRVLRRAAVADRAGARRAVSVEALRDRHVEVSARRADAGPVGGGVLGIASFRNAIVEMAKRDKLTVRQTYERVLPSMGHVTMKGSVKQVCDEIEAWYTEKALRRLQHQHAGDAHAA